MLDTATIGELRQALREIISEEVARALRGGGVSPLMTVSEVAELLRTTPKAVYHRIERGQLPGVVHDGDRLLVRRAELLRYLSEGRGPSPRGSR
jgi:excisionase family DNA binding protein